MSDIKAAGPKAELVGVSCRLQKLVEDQIEAMTQGVAHCMEMARGEPTSPYDDTRSSERRDAGQMVANTAVLLTAIAKLRGEFNHNYQINRVAPPPRPSVVDYVIPHEDRDWICVLTQKEIDALSPEGYQEYVSQMVPPPQTGGSNGNAAKS